MKPVLRWTVFLAGCIGVGLYFTQPRAVDDALLDGVVGDPVNGALVFAAMGCASCHMAAEDGTADALTGGRRFATDFGTFVAPNISPDTTHGIGAWPDIDIASAVLNGTSPSGQHYYPAFPYTSYGRATPQDVADLIAHLRSLPPQDDPNTPHEVGFPFNLRATLGGWKLLFARTDWVVEGDLEPQQQRGRYLVEALGHCGECHTPRNLLGASDYGAWLVGAPDPSGKGTIPGLTPSQLKWSDSDTVSYLKTGFTPDFDTAGGAMVEVIENLSQLPDADLSAIVAYLRRIPNP